jgi:hypothetical protein
VPACGTSISAPGVWYVVQGTGFTMEVNTCHASSNYDTKLNVYSGSCDALVCVGGNDDAACPFNNLFSRVTWPSVAGANYYILVQGFGGQVGNFGLNVLCQGEEGPPGCADATDVGCGDTVYGSTVGAPFPAVPTCGTSNTTSGVWYRLIGTGGPIEVNTCDPASNYDTKITVFSGPCGNLSCVGGNDDAACPYGNLLSRVNFNSVAGQVYHILVHGFSSQTGNFGLNVICYDPFECPEGSIPEPEPCGQDTNGGCNSSPPVFTNVSCGQTICGTAWFNGSTRDTDWYQLVLTQTTEVTYSGAAEFAGLFGYIDGSGSGNCADITGFVNPFALPAANQPFTMTVNLGPGSHWFFAAPQFAGIVTCPASYYVTFSCGDAQPCTGDLNGDGAVNALDLLQLVSQWGPCDGCSGDLNGDGRVDIYDVLILLNNWGCVGG